MKGSQLAIGLCAAVLSLSAISAYAEPATTPQQRSENRQADRAQNSANRQATAKTNSQNRQKTRAKNTATKPS